MTNQDQENKLAGFLLIFIMLIIVGVLIYAVVSSRGNDRRIVLSTGDPSPEATIAPSAKSGSPTGNKKTPPSPTVKATGKPKSTPKTSDSPKPKISPTKTTPKPTKKPKPSPTPTKDDPGPRFEPPKPDGPPDLDRVHGDIFKGKNKNDKIVVKIFSKSFPAKAYLINLDAKNYRSIKLKPIKDKKNWYKIAIPPGNYRLKIVRPYYFTFNEPFSANKGDSVDIDFDPLIKRPSLKINSRPGGARVFIAEKFAGVTPLLIRGLDAAEYSVTLQKKGYETKTLTINLPKGKLVKKIIDMSDL